MKIVLGCLDKFDFRTTLETICVVESAEQLPENNNKEITYVLAATEENIKAVENSKEKIYIPSTGLSANNQNTGWHVYFDLEIYPFYRKVKEMIGKEDKPKGVFRFRRTVKQNGNNSLLAGDLFILSSLLGKPQDFRVKQTNPSITPSHTIILVKFGGGTMAHIEYTVSDKDRIELEWSGIKKIIEFDSNQMRPVQPGCKTTLPLAYSVDDILASARKVDQELIDRLNYFSELINGGVY